MRPHRDPLILRIYPIRGFLLLLVELTTMGRVRFPLVPLWLRLGGVGVVAATVLYLSTRRESQRLRRE